MKSALCNVCDEPGTGQNPLTRSRDPLGRAFLVAHQECAEAVLVQAFRERSHRKLTGRTW